MSQIVQRFNSSENDDVIWKLCSISGLCIFGISIISYTRIIMHIWCIPEDNSHSKFDPKNIRMYSTLCVTFALLSISVTFSEYAICTQWSCLNTILDPLFVFLFWNSYIGAKFFVYVIFIGRLFNPYFQRIYQYPKYIQYLLWMLLSMMVSTVAVTNIEAVLVLEGIEYPPSIDSVCAVVYGLSDFLLSCTTMCLFFKPLYSHRPKHGASPNIYLSIVKKYGRISAVQLVSALSFQILVMGNIYFNMITTLDKSWSAYEYIAHSIQMLV